MNYHYEINTMHLLDVHIFIHMNVIVLKLLRSSKRIIIMYTQKKGLKEINVSVEKKIYGFLFFL